MKITPKPLATSAMWTAFWNLLHPWRNHLKKWSVLLCSINMPVPTKPKLCDVRQVHRCKLRPELIRKKRKSQVKKPGSEKSTPNPEDPNQWLPPPDVTKRIWPNASWLSCPRYVISYTLRRRHNSGLIVPNTNYSVLLNSYVPISS